MIPKELDLSRRPVWAKAGLLGLILGERRFRDLASTQRTQYVTTSEISTVLEALKVSDSEASDAGLSKFEVAVARYWSRLIRTKFRQGLIRYEDISASYTTIYNNPGTKR